MRPGSGCFTIWPTPNGAPHKKCFVATESIPEKPNFSPPMQSPVFALPFDLSWENCTFIEANQEDPHLSSPETRGMELKVFGIDDKINDRAQRVLTIHHVPRFIGNLLMFHFGPTMNEMAETRDSTALLTFTNTTNHLG